MNDVNPSSCALSPPRPASLVVLVLAVIAGGLVFLLVLITATLVTFSLPESYASSARLKLEPIQPGATAANTATAAAARSTREFLQTECAVMASETILAKVVQELDLKKVWGKKYAHGDLLTTAESMFILQGRLELRPIADTTLIEIRAFSDRREEAAQLANAIAQAYVAYARDRGAQVGRPAAEIIDSARPALKPARPNKPLNIALGVLFGVIAGTVVSGSILLPRLWLNRRKRQG